MIFFLFQILMNNDEEAQQYFKNPFILLFSKDEDIKELKINNSKEKKKIFRS